jgi:hypothetical protein
MKKYSAAAAAFLFGSLAAVFILFGLSGRISFQSALAAPGISDAIVLYVAPGGDCGGHSPCYAAIQDAVNAASEDDTIRIAQGTYTSQDAFVAFIDKPLTLSGGYSILDWFTPHPRSQPTILDAEYDDRRPLVIKGPAGGTISITGLTLQRGAPKGTNLDDYGAGIYIQDGTITISNCLVISNTNTNGGKGAGLYVSSGTVNTFRNVFQGNKAAGGGAVHIEDGTLTSTDDKFTANSAFWNAAIQLYSGDVNIDDGIFTDNMAGNTGGAVGVEGPGRLLVQNSLFQENRSENDYQGGGALFINDPGADVTLSNNTILSNTTSYGGSSGGGVDIQSGVVHLENNIFQGNSAAGGGAVSIGRGVVSMTRNQFRSNSAFFGGTIQVTGGELNMDGNIVLGSSGGAAQGTAMLISAGSVDAQNDVFAGSTNPDGEAVNIWAGSLTARHWTLASNGKYGVLLSAGSAALTNTIFAYHTSAAISGTNVTADTMISYYEPRSCEGGATCSNVIFDDPSFAFPPAYDFHILPGSAAFDQGVDAGVTNDMDGHSRPFSAAPDIGADELIALAAPADSDSSLSYISPSGSSMEMLVPSGAVKQDSLFVYTPVLSDTAPIGMDFAGTAFDLTGYQDDAPIQDLEFEKPVLITIQYTDAQVEDILISSLMLMYWDTAESAWQEAACEAYDRVPEENRVTVPICHLSRFALFGYPSHVLHLPQLIKD